MEGRIFELFGYAPAVFAALLVMGFAISIGLKIKDFWGDIKEEIREPSQERMKYNAADPECDTAKLENAEVSAASKNKPAAPKRKRYSTMTRVELDQYARMCNAAIEHEEEMEQYKEFYENKEGEEN